MKHIQALVAVSFACLLISGLYSLKVRDDAASNLHRAVCKMSAALLTKAQKDKAGAAAILKANPQGVPGFPRATILAAIRDDNQMIAASSDTTCLP